MKRRWLFGVVVIGLASLLGWWLLNADPVTNKPSLAQRPNAERAEAFAAAQHDLPAPLLLPRDPAGAARRVIHVVDARLVPVAGATITTLNGDLVGSTDTTGTLACSSIDAVVVSASGLLPAMLGAATAAPAVETVTLRAAIDLVVVVRNPWGEPIDDAAVSIRHLPAADSATPVAVGGHAMLVGRDGKSLAPLQQAGTTIAGTARFGGLGVGTVLVHVGLHGWVQCSRGPEGTIYRPVPVPLEHEGGVVELHLTMRPIYVAAVCGLASGQATGRYAEQSLRLGHTQPDGAEALPPNVPQHADATKLLRQALLQVHSDAAIRVLCVALTGATPRLPQLSETVRPSSW